MGFARRQLLLGIGHKARQGKDTVALAIHAAFPRETEIIPLARDLKGVARLICGMRGKDAPLLQRLGASLRVGDEDIFVKSLRCATEESEAEVVLIPDIRYRNEARFVQRFGGLLLKVERLWPDGTRFVSCDRPSDHLSETDLDAFDGWDEVIQADGRDALRAVAVQWFEGAWCAWRHFRQRGCR